MLWEMSGRVVRENVDLDQFKHLEFAVSAYENKKLTHNHLGPVTCVFPRLRRLWILKLEIYIAIFRALFRTRLN